MALSWTFDQVVHDFSLVQLATVVQDYYSRIHLVLLCLGFWISFDNTQLFPSRMV